MANHPDFLLIGSQTVKHRLKSEKNRNAEKNATTSKFGKFSTHKKRSFWDKIFSKNPLNEATPRFSLHNRV